MAVRLSPAHLCKMGSCPRLAPGRPAGPVGSQHPSQDSGPAQVAASSMQPYDPAWPASKPGQPAGAQDSLTSQPGPGLSPPPEPLLVPQTPPALHMALLIPLTSAAKGPLSPLCREETESGGVKGLAQSPPCGWEWMGISGDWGPREPRRTPRGGEQTHLGTSSR